MIVSDNMFMPRKRSWTDDELRRAVDGSFSYRNVLILLKLIPAGGNYEQIKRRIQKLNISTTHFTGVRWNTGKRYTLRSTPKLETLLIENGFTQSYKLKKKLFAAGLKQPECELCGWCEVSQDGRIPIELDHINGNRYDNRLSNLRILCPNCHSLQPTHRGMNKKKI